MMSGRSYDDRTGIYTRSMSSVCVKAAKFVICKLPDEAQSHIGLPVVRDRHVYEECI